MKAIFAIALYTNVIGDQNKLPWGHIKEDMKFFKKTTLNTTLIMGRKTYESLPKHLPDRKIAVLTSDTSIQYPDCVMLHTLDEVLEFAKQEEDAGQKVFVTGGKQIYNLLLPYCDEIYVTHITTKDGSIITGDTAMDIEVLYNIYANPYKILDRFVSDNGYRGTFAKYTRCKNCDDNNELKEKCL